MEHNLENILHKKINKAKIYTAFLTLLIFVSIFIAIKLGIADIGFRKIFNIILGSIQGETVIEGISKSEQAIVWYIRLPRILIAVLVGSGLAVSGAVFQSLLMNPLADSYTMGVSTGAAFGASLAIFLNLFTGVYISITLCAFLGAFLTLGIVVSIARVKGYLSSANLIIAGIIVSSILSAGISIIKSASGEQVAAIVSWLMGSLAARSWEHVLLAFPIIFVCIFVCIYYANDLNIMCLGENESIALGINTQKLRMILLICGSLITAVCVSVSGIIGFIGLIVPHLLRFLIGTDNKILIPLSALLGGELLLIADTGARAFMNVEIPVGVITTLLGGPFFIYIFVKRNKSLYE